LLRKTIPPTSYGQYVTASLAVLAECLTERRNTLLKVVAFDNDIPPNRIHQALLTNRGTGIFEKKDQGIAYPVRQT
jgi:hypothetical protein